MIAALEQSGAFLEGHFQLNSGRHSNRYLEKFNLLQWPRYTELVGRKMAEALRPHEPRSIAGPVTGGILLAYEVARQLGVRGIFCERDEGAETMSFQRDFHLEPGERVAIVDDVLTTGGSVRKAIAAVRAAGGEPVAVALIVDRTGGTADLDGLPWFAATEVEMESFDPDGCALCAKGVPLTVT